MRGARLLAAAQKLLAGMGASLPVYVRRDVEDRSERLLRERMHPEAFTAAWVEGEAMSLDKAVSYAVES